MRVRRRLHQRLHETAKTDIIGACRRRSCPATQSRRSSGLGSRRIGSLVRREESSGAETKAFEAEEGRRETGGREREGPGGEEGEVQAQKCKANAQCSGGVMADRRPGGRERGEGEGGSPSKVRRGG